MAEDNEVYRAVIKRDSLPEKWPTHRHTSEFWEELGRTVATFGFLEEILGKAIFAYSATKQYETEAEARLAYDKWLPVLERALTDTLKPLSDAYGKTVLKNSKNTTTNIDELIADIKKASELRNVICHGSWGAPDSEGRSIPFFINKQNNKFDLPIDTAYLRQVQRHVAELACSVIDTVTHMGFQFPGGAGPGKVILKNK